MKLLRGLHHLFTRLVEGRSPSPSIDAAPGAPQIPTDRFREDVFEAPSDDGAEGRSGPEASLRMHPLLSALECAALDGGMHVVEQYRIRADPRYNAGSRFSIAEFPMALELQSGLNPSCTFQVAGQKWRFDESGIEVEKGAAPWRAAYSTMKQSCRESHYPEINGVSANADVVGHTWRHVRQNGAPDLRFSYNPRVPIVRYWEIMIWVVGRKWGATFRMRSEKAAARLSRALASAGVEIVPS